MDHHPHFSDESRQLIARAEAVLEDSRDAVALYKDVTAWAALQRAAAQAGESHLRNGDGPAPPGND